MKSPPLLSPNWYPILALFGNTEVNLVKALFFITFYGYRFVSFIVLYIKKIRCLLTLLASESFYYHSKGFLKSFISGLRRKAFLYFHLFVSKFNFIKISMKFFCKSYLYRLISDINLFENTDLPTFVMIPLHYQDYCRHWLIRSFWWEM